MNNIRITTKKTFNNIKQTFPTLIAVLLLISLINSLLTKEIISKIFTGTILDPLIGAIIGSISAGNPLTSYIISGELTKYGINMITITAFILTWVTVGLVQFPAESLMLGKKFAFWRNILSFLSAITIAILINFTMGII
jgi:uncharacterized membrane protein YraQ (UPF0718 family)